jgi:hypothetical protein
MLNFLDNVFLLKAKIVGAWLRKRKWISVQAIIFLDWFCHRVDKLKEPQSVAGFGCFCC